MVLLQSSCGFADRVDEVGCSCDLELNEKDRVDGAEMMSGDEGTGPGGTDDVRLSEHLSVFF